MRSSSKSGCIGGASNLPPPEINGQTGNLMALSVEGELIPTNQAHGRSRLNTMGGRLLGNGYRDAKGFASQFAASEGHDEQLPLRHLRHAARESFIKSADSTSRRSRSVARPRRVLKFNNRVARERETFDVPVQSNCLFTHRSCRRARSGCIP
jgi:hypothetical protein